MRDLFLKDLGWKLLSLFLAVAIWLTVHNILTEVSLPVHTDSNTTFKTVIYSNQPVLIVSAGADVHLFRVAPAEVAVTLTGPSEVMAVLEASQIHTTVDLTDTNANRDFRRPVEVSPPPGITLVSVDPPKVAVILPPKP